MRRLRIAIVSGLEGSCEVVDRLWWWPPPFRWIAAWLGCPSGLALWSSQLDERWHTGVWQPVGEGPSREHAGAELYAYCLECDTTYPTAGALRRAYRAGVRRVYRRRWWRWRYWRRAWVVRASWIGRCPSCLHDLTCRRRWP